MVARKLTLAHMATTVSIAREGKHPDPEKLEPDQMRLYSYYKPGLMANDYVIEARQHISSQDDTGTQTLDIMNTRLTDTTNTLAPQDFEVIVPRFSLNPDLINSYYPPDGHQDEGRILPHVVLKDPHYPWEIAAGVKDHMNGKIDKQLITDSAGAPVINPTTGKQKVSYRGMVPWIALLVFDPEELHLEPPSTSSTNITALKIPGYSSAADALTQNVKGTFNMNISDYFSIPDSSRINYKAKYTKADGTLDTEEYHELTTTIGKVDVIFPRKDLFTQIFANENDTDSLKTGVEALKYMAHVRQVNTTGVPDAGIDEEGLFSIVVSSRTGIFNNPAPQTQVCHLVSIENVDSTLGSHLTTESLSDRVGLISLFSWIYTALPPNPVNFVDTVRNLTENQQMLRTDNIIFKQLDNRFLPEDQSPRARASLAVTSRLKLGYTMARWRTQTGEETVAFNRGPLCPQPVTWPGNIPDHDLPDCSKSSQDYQIFDTKTGVMDLSYASAWQAGKLLAISDKVFSAALMRFRSVVHNSSANKTRLEANKMIPRRQLASNIKMSIKAIHTLSQGETGDPSRLRAPSFASPAPDVKNPDVVPTMSAHMKNATLFQASASPALPNSGQAIYNEFNLTMPNNNDWVIIHTWLAEKLSLGGIPPQYLIPEPTFCPPESLRFFHIDDFWLDALIDGALSIANHLDRDDDLVRREIKETFNIYLRTVVPDAEFKPQIPSYGFLIRSKVIKAMPDLRITVAWKQTDQADKRYPICRWTKWDDETLMCLLDRQSEELESIILAQPSHQQRFSFGSALDAEGKVTFDLRHLYTQGAPEEWPEAPKPDPTLANSWFNMKSRCLNLAKMAADVNKALQFNKTNDTQAYIDPIPNSCEFGLELNDPSYYFKITPPPLVAGATPPKITARDRQLYVRQPPPPPAVQPPDPKKDPIKPPVPPPNQPPPSRPSQPVTNPDSTPIPTFPSQQTKMQPQALHTSVTVPGRAVGRATLQSQFDIFVFPDYKGVPTRLPKNRASGQPIFDKQDYVPTTNWYLFDLIFSIRKKPTSTDSSLKLLKLVIDIPVLTTPPNKANASLLNPNYTGPGLRMLSNQRFIPFLYSADATSTTPIMRVELVPRSAKDVYALPMGDGRTREADFRLAESSISPVKVPMPTQIQGMDLMQQREQVVITLTEWYQTLAAPTGSPVVSTYTVIKLGATDDALPQ